MTITDRLTQAQELVQFIRDEIPLAHAMDLQLGSCDDDTFSLLAPLAPNVNDKGCAFGGSLLSLMTLSGWGLVELALRRRGESRLATEASWGTFFRTLSLRGRARIEVVSVVPGSHGQPAATLGARYVAKRRP